MSETQTAPKLTDHEVRGFLQRQAMQFMKTTRFAGMDRATRTRLAQVEAQKLYDKIQEEKNASV